ncbi:MAG TPA: RNA polymerase sigma factor [Steroidobacteraceae bacterium]|nr:RNA polymerase sigma factor [Steroidobacteraceae bacterium]HRX90251.1 RNA polymerase sigma factor [Steroidobacteraceae bacterium]
MTDEQQLVAKMQAGDAQAFGEFFNAYAGRLAAFAARRSPLDSSAIEDIVQQTLINAMRNLAQFRGESTLFTWLCQICRNQLADVRRKLARQPEMQSLTDVVQATQANVPVQLLEYRDPLDECAADSTRSAVRRSVNALPPRYARILELRYGDDLSVAEIASVLSLTESAAQSLLARARSAFRDGWCADDDSGSGDLHGSGAAAAENPS